MIQALVSHGKRRFHCRVARTLWAQAKGLMFSLPLKQHEGLLIDFGATRTDLVHMIFVFFPLCVVCLDEQGRVVAVTKKAYPFSPFAAWVRCRYVLEVRPDEGKDFEIGQRLTIKLLKKNSP